MKFTGTFVGAKLDLQRQKKLIEDYLLHELHRVANAWLTGSGGRVPVWSGMARASLLELSELINGMIVISPLRVKSRIPQGRALGTAVQEISPERAIITINTNVPHYNLQEYTKPEKGGSPSAPWHSLKAGADAYREAANTARLPRPTLKPVIRKV